MPKISSIADYKSSTTTTAINFDNTETIDDMINEYKDTEIFITRPPPPSSTILKKAINSKPKEIQSRTTPLPPKKRRSTKAQPKEITDRFNATFEVFSSNDDSSDEHDIRHLNNNETINPLTNYNEERRKTSIYKSEDQYAQLLETQIVSSNHSIHSLSQRPQKAIAHKMRSAPPPPIISPYQLESYSQTNDYIINSTVKEHTPPILDKRKNVGSIRRSKKLSAMAAGLNINLSALKPGAKKAVFNDEDDDVKEIDQSTILNKPVYKHRVRRRKSKKMIIIEEEDDEFLVESEINSYDSKVPMNMAALLNRAENMGKKNKRRSNGNTSVVVFPDNNNIIFDDRNISENISFPMSVEIKNMREEIKQLENELQIKRKRLEIMEREYLESNISQIQPVAFVKKMNEFISSANRKEMDVIRAILK